MKKYFVIGNPIKHSLSPKLHNFWIKKKNINATYDKILATQDDLPKICDQIREKKINGLNITVPFKNDIIRNLDELSLEAKETQSVNTIYFKDNKIIGHNTDIIGFKFSIEKVQYDVSKKKILILGAGGVVPSLIYSLNKMGASKIIVCNRTKSKAENLKHLFKEIDIVNWGEIPNFDMIINATSIGLKNEDIIDLDFSKVGSGKFFYDVIYNPAETNFLKIGKKMGNKVENGKMMFIYQASASFELWHGIKVNIDNETINQIN